MILLLNVIHKIKFYLHFGFNNLFYSMIFILISSPPCCSPDIIEPSVELREVLLYVSEYDLL